MAGNERLIITKEDPFNGETPPEALHSTTTATPSFFVRNHFPVPQVELSDWQLSVGGLVSSAHNFTYSELQSLPMVTLPVTLECAGNGRSGFKDVAKGEVRWGRGAVSTAEWRGVPLRYILQKCQIAKDTSEIVIEGLDSGSVSGIKDRISFSRSLPIEKAMDNDTIIALYMNGETLPPNHGFPARLIVPGWYGMASVKWLRRIEAISGAPYFGYFNGTKYVYVKRLGTQQKSEPVRELRVKSLITSPQNGQTLERSKSVIIKGFAWSGDAPISKVEVDVGNGWEAASYNREVRSKYAWVAWEKGWVPEKQGDAIISVRAIDDRGNVQPLDPMENEFQYGFNAIETIEVTVE